MGTMTARLLALAIPAGFVLLCSRAGWGGCGPLNFWPFCLTGAVATTCICWTSRQG